jgi:glucosamine kinase
MGTLHVLGIDAGATKTVCQLADEEGRVLREARGGGANLQTVGELEVEKVLHRVMEEALGDTGVRPAAICLGIAGVDREADVAVVQGLLRRIGYRARTLVVNDALIALEAGVGDGPGVIIIAGTGSIAFGRNAAGLAARAGGWGYVLGDEGGGYWLGRLALRAVVRAADGRGPTTALGPRVLAHFGVTRPEELIHEVYARALPPPAIAALARHVEEAAAEGDAVALGLIESAARELVVSARAVIERLRLTAERYPILLSGGLFTAVPRLVTVLTRQLGEVAPRAEVARLACEPAAGAVRLALAEARGGARLPAYVTA